MKHQSTTTKHLIRSILFVALLLGASLPARGQAVIMNGDYYLTHNEAGTTVNATATTTFNPATCLWDYARRDYIRTANSSGEAINNNNNYLQYDELSLGTDWGNWYRGNDEEYIYHRTGGTYSRRYHYPTRSNTTWGWEYNQTSQNSTTSLYDVNITSQAATSTNPTISGADVITAAGNTTYTASGASYRAAYTNYYFRTANHYVDANGNTITPANANITYSWSLADNAYATVNSTSGVVTVSSLPEYDITLTLTVTATATGGTPAAPAGTTLTASKEITIQGTKPSAPIISVSGNNATLSTDAAGSTSIRYTLDGSDPTASTGTVYSGAIDLSASGTSPVTIKAITVRNGNASAVSEEIVTLTLPTPVITVNGSAGTATIACDITGTTIYYTTNGSTPTTSSSQYSGTLSGLSPMTTIKAIAVKDGWNNSPVASATVTIPSGVSGGVVTLFDYEDHNWTYYSGVPSTVDGGNYNTNYLGKLYSPNPRNVKITYNANGGAVSISESETEFVYYKTLEEGTTSGQYPYQVISNPFSKRPNGKGFGGWKIKEGADYISGYADEAILPLDAEIVFTNLPYPSVNCTSAEIELEATWVNYNNRTYASGNTFTYSVTGGTYETNFLVLNRNVTGTITVSSPCTIMMVEPDGSTDYRGSYTFSGTVTPNNDGVTKIEWARWTTTGTINATGRNFTIGRGITRPNGGGTLYGTNTDRNINQTFKVESGIYQYFYAIGGSGPANNMTKQDVILGNDYDRAKSNNDNLTITNNMMLMDRATAVGTDKLVVTTKSGKFTTQLDHSTAQASGNCFYLWNNNSTNGATGTRTLIIEGGELWHIAGGVDYSNSNDVVNLKIRMKGGTVHGSIYGGAARYDAHGGKQFVFTGGTVEGWIAGGSNGFLSVGSGNDNGSTQGNSYVYVGGTTSVNSNGSTTAVNVALGGNVYGAGCGNEDVNVSGRVTLGTNVVVADNCYVERGAYGGGAYGSSPATANVYVTGNAHVGCANDPTFNVAGGVYGGARAKGGGSVNIYMTGGNIDGSVYGGSNASGNLSGAVSVKVYGGRVTDAVYGCNNIGGAPQSTVTVDVYGTDPAPSAGSYAINQVFGGGNHADYGGTPAVTVHCTDANKDISVGEIYGGGNQADVAATNVTIEAGNIIGDVYGGGRQADVNGNTVVNVNGGTVRRVFGGNNMSGTIGGTISVTANKTTACPMMIGELYGGGNEAASQAGSITIGCTGDITADHLAVGADAGATPPSAIGHTLEGIGDVYGGANNALVTGDITLDINSGMIYRVFGGNNTGNTVSGDITVNVAQGAATCGWYVGYVYGGGNNAAYSNAGNAFPAVNHSAGKVTYNVYGGGKGSTAIVTSNPKVILSGTAQVGGNVFGGGNAAEVKGNTNVMLKN